METCKKSSLSDIAKRYFSESRYSTRNFFLFTMALAVLSRICMYLFYVAVRKSFVGLGDLIGGVWDNGWYSSVILNGYALYPSGHDAGDAANWAFFPLDAVIIKILSFGGRLDYRYVGLAVNTLFAVLAITFAYKYITLNGGSLKTAITFAVLILFGPYGFYCACLYTEALFMLLTVLFLYEMRKENFILMGVAGAFLSATRNIGVLAVFAVLFYIIQRHVKEKRGGFKSFLVEVLSDYKLLLGVFLTPLGLFLYMLYLRFHVGDALAFMHIQKAWGRSVGDTLSALRSFLIPRYIAAFAIAVLVLVASAVLFRISERHVKREADGYIKSPVLRAVCDHKLLFGVLSAVLVLLLCMLCLRIRFGDLLAFMHARYLCFYYALVFAVVIFISVYQMKRRPYETVLYVIPCLINLFSLGFINLARYSWGSGIAVIGFIDAVNTYFSKSARIVIYVILACLAVQLQYSWFIRAPITIG